MEARNPPSSPLRASDLLRHRRATEQFQDGHHVRLRSRETGAYLHADEDGRRVSLHHRRASMNAAWAVHIYQGYGDSQYVLLHSAAYGRYLAATNAPAPRGHSGRRVEQCDYEPWEEEYIRWQAVRVGSGDDVLLRNVAGRLRANGRYLSVDDFNSIGTMMHWVVEHIPARNDAPRLAAPTGQFLPNLRHARFLILPELGSWGFNWGFVFPVKEFRAVPCFVFDGSLELQLRLPRSLAFVLPWRVIQYEQEGAEESNASFAWESLVFRGRSAYHLRKELASRLGVAMDVSNLVMCVRAGMHGRLTPLVVDLPHSRETLDIIVVMPGTPDVNLRTSVNSYAIALVCNGCVLILAATLALPGAFLLDVTAVV
ncbi:uncharacterized protein LOC123408192 [Hordeum vulgare subsp. vulgare]|uniref:uncharacterized protein LOC123408192 n=1 Tax=Hordeum vulgare subsp. vulgare TaxID=112509 RepID=UPI001D1A4FDC|nr:uncharacterized protein LOC123408192 [Hordeum vulgare subsp. vulgare]